MVNLQFTVEFWESRDKYPLVIEAEVVDESYKGPISKISSARMDHVDGSDNNLETFRFFDSMGVLIAATHDPRPERIYTLNDSGLTREEIVEVVRGFVSLASQLGYQYGGDLAGATLQELARI